VCLTAIIHHRSRKHPLPTSDVYASTVPSSVNAACTLPDRRSPECDSQLAEPHRGCAPANPQQDDRSLQQPFTRISLVSQGYQWLAQPYENVFHCVCVSKSVRCSVALTGHAATSSEDKDCCIYGVQNAWIRADRHPANRREKRANDAAVEWIRRHS